MAHIPVNHHLRPVYRTVAGACGLYVLAFGILATMKTRGLGLFAQDGLPSVLGLRANLAFAILSIVAGVVVLAGSIVGRNVDHWINLVGGIVFLVAGMTMMILMQTDLNFLGFTMTTCIVSFIIGMLLISAGLYGKVGTSRDVAFEEQLRHGGPKAGPQPQPQPPPRSASAGPRPNAAVAGDR